MATDLYRYRGKTPVSKGDKVDLIIDDEVWGTAKVLDTLAMQFTCKQVRYYLYSDNGFTWRKHRVN
jgi:hypothetical protein